MQRDNTPPIMVWAELKNRHKQFLVDIDYLIKYVYGYGKDEEWRENLPHELLRDFMEVVSADGMLRNPRIIGRVRDIVYPQIKAILEGRRRIHWVSGGEKPVQWFDDLTPVYGGETVTYKVPFSRHGNSLQVLMGKFTTKPLALTSIEQAHGENPPPAIAHFRTRQDRAEGILGLAL